MFKCSKYINGALTSKAYAYKARSWELKKKLGLNFFEVEGSLVLLEYRDKEVLRVIPKVVKNKLNFISDKIRFFYDSLKVQRLYVPLWKNYKIHKLEKINWVKFFEFYIFYNKFVKNNVNLKVIDKYYLGSHIGVKNMLYLKSLINSNSLYYNNVIIDNMSDNFEGLKENYILYENVVDDINILIFFGTNITHDYPILKLILKKKVSKICYFGIFDSNNGNNILHLGNNILNIISMWKGKSEFLKHLLKKESIYLFFSVDFFRSNCNLYEFLKMNKINKYIKFKYLKLSSTFSELHSREYGLTYSSNVFKNINDFEYTYLFNYDKFNYLFNLKKKSLKVYQGSQGFDYLKNMDFVLPQTSLFEEKNMFLNIFGIKNYLYKTFNKVVEIKKTEKILKNLLNVNSFFKKTIFSNQVELVDKLNSLNFIKNNLISSSYCLNVNKFKCYKGILSRQILLYYGDSNMVKLSTNLSKMLKIEKDLFYNYIK